MSDRDLLDATVRVAGDERRTTTRLLALLAELDTRKLYLGEGCSSLFTYCTGRLRLSEPAAYSRITAARAARRFPILLTRLAYGNVTLTTISLLSAHLTDENHEVLLDAARRASKRDVERLVASLHAQPDIPASVRRIPDRVPSAVGRHASGRADEPSLAGLTGPPAPNPAGAKSAKVSALPQSQASAAPVASSPTPWPTRAVRRPPVAPLAADRYLLRVTIGAQTHAKLERARDLLRHTTPNGDLAAIIAARPMQRDRLPRVPPPRAVCRRRGDRRGEPRTALPRAQRLRGDGVVWSG